MDKYAKLAMLLRQNGKDNGVPLMNATVKELTGESCTVEVFGDLELTDVRLKATINGSGNRLLILPKVGSMVLIGSLTGDLKDLGVLKVDEMEKMEYTQDGLKILIDSTDNKLSISNGTTSLKDLFQQIKDIFQGLGLFTPSGATTGILPTTQTAVTKFETDFKTLLK